VAAATDPPIPDQADAPVVWDPAQRRFVDAAVSEPAQDERRFFVPADVTAAPAKAPAPSLLKPADTPPAPPKARSRTRRRVIIAVAVLLPVVLLAGGLLWADATFRRIDRVHVGDLLDHGGPATNYLIVGSDSRAGVDPDDPNAGAIVGAGAPDGQRSDTILILRIQGAGATMLSIPRDLWVTVADTGKKGRINSAYNGGARRLIETVKANLSIPVNRYIEIDFVAFAKLVDAVGGVVIDFPNPAFDDHSGLYVDHAGPVKLDGTQALAYVRSRHYTEIIDGKQHPDPTGDLGRVTRQQQFLRAVLAKAGASRNPFTLMRIATALAGGLRIDDKMGLLEAMRFAWRMGKLHPTSVPLPVDPKTIGGAAVLTLTPGAGEDVLAQFR
jgi:LCP family protein required for cell wall assembly